MSDESKLIGLGACPVCKQLEARFTLTKSNLVCCTCRQPRCGIQCFARTGDSDEKMRAFIKPGPAPEPAPAKAPTAETQPPAIEPVKPETKKSTGASWGMGLQW